MTLGRAPGTSISLRAQQRHRGEAEVPRGHGRELRVEVVGAGEDAAHHRVRLERVALHDLAHELLGRGEDRVRLVGLDGGGASERAQLHAAQQSGSRVAGSAGRSSPTTRLPYPLPRGRPPGRLGGRPAQPLHLGPGQPAALPRLEAAQAERPEGHPLELDHPVPHRLDHPAHLALLALPDRELHHAPCRAAAHVPERCARPRAPRPPSMPRATAGDRRGGAPARGRPS